MTFLNAEVLHKHFLNIGNLVAAKQLEVRFPSLIVKSKRVKKNGKV